MKESLNELATVFALTVLVGLCVLGLIHMIGALL